MLVGRWWALCCVVVGSSRNFPSPQQRIIARELVSEGREVGVFSRKDPLRYLSLVDNNMIFGKRGEWPDADKNEKTWILDSFSGGHQRIFQNDSNIAHNLAVYSSSSEFVALGGRDNGGRSGASVMRNGVWRRVLRGKHTGCIERRVDFAPRCEFDGRFSLAKIGSEWFVYARANLNPLGGGRFVQVTTTKDFDKFSPFRLIQFATKVPASSRIDQYDLDCATRYGNVYYAAVNANPVDNRTHLGLFPLRIENIPDEDRIPTLDERRRKVNGIVWSEAYFGRGGWVTFPPSANSSMIALALTCDGVHFSTPKPLVAALPASIGRTNDHPIDGFVVKKHSLYFFVHVGVPGTFGKRPPAFRMSPPSSVHRYKIRTSALRTYTREAVAQLAQSCPLS